MSSSETGQTPEGSFRVPPELIETIATRAAALAEERVSQPRRAAPGLPLLPGTAT
jgi:hypothetical protein